MANKIIIYIFFCFLLIGCSSSENNDQIKVTIKVIDSETRQPRVNDTVTIRQAKWGIPRRYVEVGQYVTDSLGSVTLRINKVNRYSFETDGPNFAFGSDEYGEGELKNNQQIVIKVVPPDKKQFRIE
ncbi:hypothetical protein SD427_04260 [Chryseobacterium sp. JJR-5R]|uniref:hypothetical protein n=1 Tax=Chryseobacterium sp. JJR-5R TaxID=3093923 RepID=UPI002A754677|nr:hypothetical protein [Chryseobacterium sp. JJR-5R]WPO83556.1 hypothetical protein SD427_04260 [Chryseobacterium sp. JJR-5R]